MIDPRCADQAPTALSLALKDPFASPKKRAKQAQQRDGAARRHLMPAWDMQSALTVAPELESGRVSDSLPLLLADDGRVYAGAPREVTMSGIARSYGASFGVGDDITTYSRVASRLVLRNYEGIGRAWANLVVRFSLPVSF
jgi:hypothetical protein